MGDAGLQPHGLAVFTTPRCDLYALWSSDEQPPTHTNGTGMSECHPVRDAPTPPTCTGQRSSRMFCVSRCAETGKAIGSTDVDKSKQGVGGRGKDEAGRCGYVRNKHRNGHEREAGGTPTASIHPTPRCGKHAPPGSARMLSTRNGDAVFDRRQAAESPIPPPHPLPDKRTRDRRGFRASDREKKKSFERKDKRR